MRRRQDGNAVLFILLGIVLFGALSYAFIKSSRNNGSDGSKQRQSLTASEYQSCLNAVELADAKLQSRGCAGLVSRQPDGSNPIAGAPTDGSCSIFHPSGGNLAPCVPPDCSTSQLNALGIGQSCMGLIYAGSSGGNRLYTTAADLGSTYSWASGSLNTTTGAASNSDGLTNTNTLVALADAASPYSAAIACRNLGAKWYLPARDELIVLSTNSSTGELAGTFDVMARHWTSTDWPTSQALSIENSASRSDGKGSPFNVRCVRRN